MQTLLTQLQEIKNLFKPNPMLARGPLDAVFELNFSENAEHVEIEIKQFIFSRCRVLIPKAGGNFTIVTCGQPDVTGTDDLPALKNALIELGYLKSPKQDMTKLFTHARKPKNKYPRQRAVRR
jgi:hypothetical protein